MVFKRFGEVRVVLGSGGFETLGITLPDIQLVPAGRDRKFSGSRFGFEFIVLWLLLIFSPPISC